MIRLVADRVGSGSTTALTTVILLLGLEVPFAHSQDEKSPANAESVCRVDLFRPGMMKDIVSNALMRGLNRPEPEVAAFLRKAESRYATGADLLAGAAGRFKISEAVLESQVQKFKHCNCKHGPLLDGPSGPCAVENGGTKLSRFAEDVVLHVVLHELAHALIREFDLPILGNEETMADAFATHYLTAHLPERALDVLKARTDSLLIEAGEVPREKWSVSGEHNNDARRAFQIAALAVAADPEKYTALATGIGMTEDDIKHARDYGTEIHRSWRRVLQPLLMPDGMSSREARVKSDSSSAIAEQLQNSGLVKELESTVRRFDWHSQVTIYFAEGDGGAGWSRSTRTITIHEEYIRRFIQQGAISKKRTDWK